MQRDVLTETMFRLSIIEMIKRVEKVNHIKTRAQNTEWKGSSERLFVEGHFKKAFLVYVCSATYSSIGALQAIVWLAPNTSPILRLVGSL